MMHGASSFPRGTDNRGAAADVAEFSLASNSSLLGTSNLLGTR
jgi:hypothetical protein